MPAKLPAQPLRFTLILAAALVLTSCSQLSGLFGTPAKHATKPKETAKYDANTYIEQISIAHIILQNGGDLNNIAANTKPIEAYGKQKQTKTLNPTLALLEYINSKGKTRQSIAPLEDDGSLTAITHVMDALEKTNYKLKDVRVLASSLPPAKPIKINGQTLDNAAGAIAAQHQALIASGHKLDPVADAKLQLKLLHFFTAQKQRDAAYSCAQNVKHNLSVAARGDNPEEINQMNKELEEAEGELRKALPY